MLDPEEYGFTVTLCYLVSWLLVVATVATVAFLTYFYFYYLKGTP